RGDESARGVRRIQPQRRGEGQPPQEYTKDTLAMIERGAPASTPTIEAPAPPAPTNGSATHADVEAPRERDLGFPRPPGMLFLLVGTLLVALLGALYFTQSGSFVSTDNAVVEGEPVSIGSPTNGQIRAVPVNVGDEVRRRQVVATILPANAPPSQVVAIRSPIDGTVITRSGNP